MSLTAGLKSSAPDGLFATRLRAGKQGLQLAVRLVTYVVPEMKISPNGLWAGSWCLITGISQHPRDEATPQPDPFADGGQAAAGLPGW